MSHTVLRYAVLSLAVLCVNCTVVCAAPHTGLGFMVICISKLSPQLYDCCACPAGNPKDQQDSDPIKNRKYDRDTAVAELVLGKSSPATA